MDLLETSLFVKRTKFVSPDVAIAAATHIPPKAAAEALSTAELFLAPDPPIDPETGVAMEVESPNEYDTEDLLAMTPLFAAVGAGLGRVETIMAYLAIKQLGEDPKLMLKTVRFFGKFLGTSGDYFVFEATLKTPEPATEPEEGAEQEYGRPISKLPSEENGTGSNKNVYFVCSFLGGSFTRLPDVKPLMVTSALSLKKFLTGKLDSEVSAYPPFPGREAEFLRAQIAIIASETVLCPSGLYTTEGEDSLDVLENEDFAEPAYSDVASWVHLNPSLNSQGRCLWYTAPPVEGEEESADALTPEPIKILTSASDDEDINEGIPAWTVVCSSTIPGLKHVTYAMRSNKYPGAIAVAKGSSFSNMYVGYGISTVPLKPPFPPVVSAEAVEEAGESEEVPEPPEQPAVEEETPAEA